MISYIIAHNNRLDLLECNLISLIDQSDSNFEIIIVDNSNNYIFDHLKNLTIKYRQLGLSIRLIRVDPSLCVYSHAPSLFNGLYNPALQQNVGVKQASGDIIVLTSPEVINARFNVSNIEKAFANKVSKFVLGWISEKHKEDLSSYSLTNEEMFKLCPIPTDGASCRKDKWSPKSYFLGCIKKNDFIKIGGIEEKYMAGMGYDDDDFSTRCIKNNITPILDVNIAGIHIYHTRAYQSLDQNPNPFIWMKNKAQIANQNHDWGSDKYIIEKF